MSEEKHVHVGPGLATLLLVLFVALKLTDQIDWAWVWVLSPLWVSAAIWVAVLAIVLVVALCMAASERRAARKARAAWEQTKREAGRS